MRGTPAPDRFPLRSTRRRTRRSSPDSVVAADETSSIPAPAGTPVPAALVAAALEVARARGEATDVEERRPEAFEPGGG